MPVVFAKRMLQLPLLAALALAMMLTVGIACGGAGEPEVASSESAAPAATAVPQAAAAATAAPSPTEAPAMMESKDFDKFTVMVTTQGNELFNSKYAAGENNLWHRMAQVWLVGGSLQDGSLVLDPATGIANKWEIVDDGVAWEFTIRPGIQFHNGEELDVNDVAFMANWSITEEAAGVSTVRIAREIVNREVTGPDTFKYTFKEPLAFFGAAVSEVDNTAIGTVISEDYFKSLPLGQTIENCTPIEVCQQAEAFEENPNPGLPGPFQVMSHRYEEEILYERFEDYFLRQERPFPFQTLSLRVVPELSTRVAALQAGEVDIIEADNTVVGQIQDAGGRIVYAPESVHIWINANGCNRETDNDGVPIMCNDLRVRQALDYAIDKTQIQALYGGSDAFEINGMHGIGSPSGLGFEPDLGPLPFDPDKAQQLMADAGYPGGAGFNGGQVFPIHTWTGAGAPLTVELSTLICQSWETVLGIECEVNVGEEVSLKEVQYAGEIAGQYLVRTNENTYDGGRRMLGRYAREGAYIAFDTDIAEKVLAAGAMIGTQEERHQAYYDALRIIHDKHYDFTPGFLNQPYGVSDRVGSWTPWPLAPYMSALWTVEVNQ
ncbi:MAG: ABC transporter substrate-binding protein [Chloroflexi bacterium]|nr:ABC transporter substrate-binding protein [Chloroflexota bacterium]